VHFIANSIIPPFGHAVCLFLPYVRLAAIIATLKSFVSAKFSFLKISFLLGPSRSSKKGQEKAELHGSDQPHVPAALHPVKERLFSIN